MEKRVKKSNELAIQPQLEKGGGIDIHKTKMVGFIYDQKGQKNEWQEFPTYTKDLKRLRDWLLENHIQDVLMESTGVYWISLYNILTSSGIRVVVANPQSIKQIPKRKTDKKDAKWLCKLLINGLVRPSFIPPIEQQELRELCRNRLFYTQQIAKIRNKIVKILEGNNIKIRSVVSIISTKSSMEIIKKLSEGITDISELLSSCYGTVKKKAAAMADALDGTLSQHSRDLLKMLLSDIAHNTQQKNELDQRIKKIVEDRYNDTVGRLQNISGVGEQSSQIIVSEIGDNMGVFPNADHLTSWTGFAPGNNESAGKRKPVSVKKGNKYLRVALIAVAWAAVRTKDSYWRALFENLKKRMKSQKAIVAIARRLLKVIYKIIETKEEYIEKGLIHFFELKNKREEYLRKVMA